MKKKILLVLLIMMFFSFIVLMNACRKTAPQAEQTSTPQADAPVPTPPSSDQIETKDTWMDDIPFSLDEEDAPPVTLRHPSDTDLSIIFCNDIVEEMSMPISPSKEFKEGQNFYFFISSKENFAVDSLRVMIVIIDPQTKEALLYDEASISVNPGSDVTFFPFSLPEGYYVVIVQQGDIAEARSELIIHAPD